eukprot:TRINITY_DN9280_c0_g1_i1.p1 TRINITY_DN9280_c0_g1~~TRINITY_DN9280_c0_g1_i1.p1  ORF type:complete len:292 (+),score=53.33 TRINITY_DN9280_c0_g1_i1:50-925(+)
MQNLLHSIAEAMTPSLTTSQFLKKGVLTPEEFVAAGDFLVFKCPTWSWSAGEPSKVRQNLPPNKQFLITKNVPCLRRTRMLEASIREELQMEEGEDGGWVAAQSSDPSVIADIPDISGVSLEDVPSTSQAAGGDDDEIPDMDDYSEDGIAGDDPSELRPSQGSTSQIEEDNIQKTRTYDLSISYDKYYQTPRVWLYGYDEHGKPLKPEQTFEDISQDHAHKTVTIEAHPHLSAQHASIHPCRHAAVMKKIVDHLVESGREVRPDQYIFLFLKFISSVIPTIEYDYTMQMDG